MDIFWKQIKFLIFEFGFFKKLVFFQCFNFVVFGSVFMYVVMKLGIEREGEREIVVLYF